VPAPSFPSALAAAGLAPLRRAPTTTLQVNVGLRCDLACHHCHVEAGPKRSEALDEKLAARVLEVLACSPALATLDLTGGAPELNPHFRRLARSARALGVQVIDRCNLTILFEPGQEDLAEFLADERVDIVASLPCYSLERVDRQRGAGVFDKSIAALRKLNALGYGDPDAGLVLNLVYNPQGPSLPPDQHKLQADYQRELGTNFGIRFNKLFALANMPIQRFGSTLVSKGEFQPYMQLLKRSFRPENLDTVMCTNLVSVDWTGALFDCDFNQMLGLPMRLHDRPRAHLRDLLDTSVDGGAIRVADHCYGCTAGQGSGCGGALLAA
jgi:radical SAM/Cys-rich protein